MEILLSYEINDFLWMIVLISRGRTVAAFGNMGRRSQKVAEGSRRVTLCSHEMI
jgi:hypothetical protein